MYTSSSMLKASFQLINNYLRQINIMNRDKVSFEKHNVVSTSDLKSGTERSSSTVTFIKCHAPRLRTLASSLRIF